MCLVLQVACCALPTVQAFQATPPASALGVDVRLMALAGGLVLLFLAVKKLLDTPSRTYNPDAPNVGDEYDNWTQCAPRRLCWVLHTVFSLGLWLSHFVWPCCTAMSGMSVARLPTRCCDLIVLFATALAVHQCL